MLNTGKKSERRAGRKHNSTAASGAGRKPTVSIIGAGRLGTALGRALATAGYRLEAVVTRHVDSEQKAAQLISSRPCPLTVAELDELPNSDLVLLSAPDDAIAETTRQ